MVNKVLSILPQNIGFVSLQTSSYVAEAWYMLHSAAAQLEYLITLNKTLQNLIYEELSRTFTPAREDTENKQVSNYEFIDLRERNIALKL